MAFVQAIFNQLDSNGAPVSCALTGVGAGNFLVCCFAFDGNAGNTDRTVTWSDNVTPDLSFTEPATGDIYNSTDIYGQEIAIAQFAAGGNITVTATRGSNSVWGGLCVAEFSEISAYDTISYLRTTGAPINCGSVAAASQPNMRVAFGVAWGGGTLAANTGAGWSDGGSGATYGGTPAMRMQYQRFTSTTAQTAPFSAGSGVSPFHCTQVVLTETTGGGGGGGGNNLYGIRRSGMLGNGRILTL